MTISLNETQQEPKSNPLGDINAQFHRLYQQEKDKALRRIEEGELMLVCRMDNRLIIKKGQSINEHIINGEHYHNVKAMSHATLATYYLLKHSVNNTSLEQVKQWAYHVRQQAPAKLTQELSDITLRLIDDIACLGVLTHSAMNQYQQALEPVYAKLMRQAADDEIHNLVTALKDTQRTSPHPSSAVFFIVFGAHQPRYKALAIQVFNAWVSTTKEHIGNKEHHVRYCESGSSMADAIDLIATAIVDKELAKSTMGYAEALNKDVLSVVAQSAIDDYWQKHHLP